MNSTVEQHTIELLVYVVGKNHHETLELKDQMVNSLQRDFGIRKLADMGDQITLEYRPPEFEWTMPRALSQLEHGDKETRRTKSALRFIENYYRLEG
jgi:hypothetical protein